ncbi:hypothetical protein Tco_0658593 [Tanacetum coccineum]
MILGFSLAAFEKPMILLNKRISRLENFGLVLVFVWFVLSICISIYCRDHGWKSVKEMTTNFGKLDKFEGHDFRRWQKKMHFLLTTLKVVYVLATPLPELMKNDTVKAIRRRAKWENDDYIYMGHILNGMSDSLFDIYQNVESAKELWYSLESKYMA